MATVTRERLPRALPPLTWYTATGTPRAASAVSRIMSRYGMPGFTMTKSAPSARSRATALHGRCLDGCCKREGSDEVE
jgi:hypothetical protein